MWSINEFVPRRLWTGQSMRYRSRPTKKMRCTQRKINCLIVMDYLQVVSEADMMTIGHN